MVALSGRVPFILSSLSAVSFVSFISLSFCLSGVSRKEKAHHAAMLRGITQKQKKKGGQMVKGGRGK